MKKEIKVALIECYPKRIDPINDLFMQTKYKSIIKTSIFRIHKGEKLPDFSFDGYVYSGGAIFISEKHKYKHLLILEKFTKKLAEKNKPLLGICLGHQLVALTFGGKIERFKKPEVGVRKISCFKKNKLLKNISKEFNLFFFHDEYVSNLPEDFKNFAHTKKCKIQLIKHNEKPIYGIQFHPEYDERGSKEIIDCEKENLEKNFDIGKLKEEAKFHSKKESVKLFENFVEIMKKQKDKNENRK